MKRSEGKTEAEHAAARPKTSPADPEANLEAGKRLCFEEDKWAEGLPLLANGSDAQLKQVAIEELKDNASPKERLTLGDRWWDYAGSEVGAVWKGSLRRAAYWYRQAIRAAGPRKPELEQRLKDLEEQPPGFEVLARRVQVFPNESRGTASCTHLLLRPCQVSCVRAESLK